MQQVVTELQNGWNYLTIGFALMCLLGGFGFGWKSVQRGTSQ